MSLSARIAVGPSLPVAWLAAVVASGGWVVAGVTVAARRPDAIGLVVAAATAGCVLAIAGIVRRHRATPRIVLSVSDRAGIGIDGDERTWRLAQPTMSWPGFSMLAIVADDPLPRPGVLCYPLVNGDIAPADRRPLSRFLLWSLRGGGAAGRA